ncbi:2-phospho-L-lactate guanylyltransferase [Microbacterium amylolyticum]|uniref:Phosphoenolpyruvate guanylyltransferase n=1 Tax=Microbacterium amylolyticum TaxID=936337 RepID=A0ABS4ZJN3_9MICO|nr:2-phospho-L-lactate guanylyltransferase [Microbacterium amylolyticum]MBP2436681.1 2-phospho-L-lactate guanylyltransferase [Microbacterium amylolyticum]
MSGSWSLVIPVKPTADGKSRLDGARLPRPALALAIALDTIAAAADARCVDEVIVVTSSADVIAGLEHIPGTRAIPDPGMGLNGAVRAGLAQAAGPARAAMLGDLPALSAHDLDGALTAGTQYARAFVPDAEGTGTTLVMWRDVTLYESRFGAGSANEHRAAAFVALPVDAPGLRRDVDTAEQLRDAAQMGLGPRTTNLLRAVEAA